MYGLKTENLHIRIPKKYTKNSGIDLFVTYNDKTKRLLNKIIPELDSFVNSPLKCDTFIVKKLNVRVDNWDKSNRIGFHYKLR